MEKETLGNIFTVIGGALMVISFIMAQIMGEGKYYFFFTGLVLGLIGFVLRPKQRKKKL